MTETHFPSGQVEQKRKQEKKSDPFQNRKGRAPSLLKFQIEIKMIAFAKDANSNKNPADSVGHPPPTSLARTIRTPKLPTRTVRLDVMVSFCFPVQDALAAACIQDERIRKTSKDGKVLSTLLMAAYEALMI